MGGGRDFASWPYRAFPIRARILQRIGLCDFVVTTKGEYVSITERCDAVLYVLGNLKGAMRATSHDAPFADSSAVTRELESCIRRMWITWCAEFSLTDRMQS